MNTDLSFRTNEKNQSLKNRFEVLIKDTSLFDCLVGYFYTTGFHTLTDFDCKGYAHYADPSALKQQIDNMVYKLYDLTEDEIAIVEGKG